MLVGKRVLFKTDLCKRTFLGVLRVYSLTFNPPVANRNGLYLF